ncbi:hypothetical protein ADUPG1_008263, partial [Aduncisulcus paluster]
STPMQHAQPMQHHAQPSSISPITHSVPSSLSSSSAVYHNAPQKSKMAIPIDEDLEYLPSSKTQKMLASHPPSSTLPGHIHSIPASSVQRSPYPRPQQSTPMAQSQASSSSNPMNVTVSAIQADVIQCINHINKLYQIQSTSFSRLQKDVSDHASKFASFSPTSIIKKDFDRVMEYFKKLIAKEVGTLKTQQNNSGKTLDKLLSSMELRWEEKEKKDELMRQELEHEKERQRQLILGAIETGQPIVPPSSSSSSSSSPASSIYKLFATVMHEVSKSVDSAKDDMFKEVEKVRADIHGHGVIDQLSIKIEHLEKKMEHAEKREKELIQKIEGDRKKSFDAYRGKIVHLEQKLEKEKEERSSLKKSISSVLGQFSLLKQSFETFQKQKEADQKKAEERRKEEKESGKRRHAEEPMEDIIHRQMSEVERRLRVMVSENEKQTTSISSQSDVSVLYKSSTHRIKDIFSKYSSSDSEIKTHREILTLCFKCLSFFIKHEAIPSESLVSGDSHSPGKTENVETVILDNASIKELFDTFLANMLRVEVVLRSSVLYGKRRVSSVVSPSETEAVETLEKEKGYYGVNTITKSLFKIVFVSLSNVPSLGHDSIKDSLLSLLLPHILPWMKKYSDKQYMSWMSIFEFLSYDKNCDLPHEGRCSQLWFLFHPVLDIIKSISFEDSVDISIMEHSFEFFACLSCISVRAVHIYENIKGELLDRWLTFLQENKEDQELLFDYFFSLISMLSTDPVLIPLLKSPEFEYSLKLCSFTGYLHFIRNCYPEFIKWTELISTVKACDDSETLSKLYHEHRTDILSVFTALKSPTTILAHKTELELCFICLKFLAGHDIDGDSISLSYPDFNDLIDTFFVHLSSVENVLEKVVDEEYCYILYVWYSQVEIPIDQLNSPFFKVSPTLQRILKISIKEILCDDILSSLLLIFQRCSDSSSLTVKVALFDLFQPYLKDWLRAHSSRKEISEYLGDWMTVLSNSTYNNEILPGPLPRSELSLYSRAWTIFQDTILDVIKTQFVGEKILDNRHFFALGLLGNLSLDPTCTVQLFNSIEDFIEPWFELMIRKKHRNGMDFLMVMIARLSCYTPSIIPRLAKFDQYMHYKPNIPDWEFVYSLYIEKCFPPLKKWTELAFEIHGTPIPWFVSTLFQKHKESILSTLLQHQSTSQIMQHKNEIKLCFQCLSQFVCHDTIDGTEVALPLSDLNVLISTFIGHLSRITEVLKGAVDEEYVEICQKYFAISDNKGVDSLFPKVVPILQQILEGEMDEDFNASLISNLLLCFREVSKSPSLDTRSDLITVVKHATDWISKFSIGHSDWMYILSHATFDNSHQEPTVSICAEAWSLFPAVLEIVQEEFVGEDITEENNIEVLRFFSNLCCDPTHALEVYAGVKDFLSGWFVLFKDKQFTHGILAWANLISMLSTCPSLVPNLSPKFDSEMEYRHKNGPMNADYTRFMSNCRSSVSTVSSKTISTVPSIIEILSELPRKIQSCSNSLSVSNLYHESRKFLLSVFLDSPTNDLIEKNLPKILQVSQCLNLFAISGKNQYFSMVNLINLVGIFVPHMSRVVNLNDSIDKEYCWICMNYSSKFEKSDQSPQISELLPKISSALDHILLRGEKALLPANTAIPLLHTLKNISNINSSSIRRSIFTLAKPHISKWLNSHRELTADWFYFLAKVTSSGEMDAPNKDICAEAWDVFRPILDVVWKAYVGDQIFESDISFFVIRFFSNLCCNATHTVEIHENIKYLLSGWFEAIKKAHQREPCQFWSRLISMLVTVPSLVSQLSPKFDEDIKWCHGNGMMMSEDYSRYLSCCGSSVKSWFDLCSSINKCPDSESTSKLYLKHRPALFSSLVKFQSKSQIEEHKREIILCCQCLKWFVRHTSFSGEVFLPLSELNDLFSVFIDHLSRIEEVLGGEIGDEFCSICMFYAYITHNYAAVFSRTSPALKRILERGSKQRLEGKYYILFIKILDLISRSPIISVRSALLSLIKPYLKDWLRIYKNSDCYGDWMCIVSHITRADKEEIPNKALCAEAWPLFRPILALVQREFVGERIVLGQYFYVLRFFSNLCCDAAHALTIHNNVKDLLSDWVKAIHDVKHTQANQYLVELTSMLATVPFLITLLSPKTTEKE